MLDLGSPSPDKTTPDSAESVRGLRVLMVFQSFRQDTTSFAFLTDVKNLGAIQPLNLLQVGAWMIEHEIEVSLLDANALELTLPEALESARSYQFDFVCFTVTNLDYLFAIEWIRAFDRTFGKPILVGGAGVEAYPEDVASDPAITAAFHSPAEACLVEWLAAYVEGGSWWTVPGTCSVYEGKLYNNRPLTLKKGFVRPHPARQLVDSSLYFTLLSGNRRFTSAMSIIGCPYSCAFCAERRRVTHIRSAEDVVDEMEICEKEFGIAEIDFFDAGFTMSRDRTLRIAEIYKQRRLRVQWSARVRIDKVDPEQLRAMASMNCRWLGYGIESADLGVLSQTNKPQGTVELFHRNLQATRDAGIDTTGFFVLGLPGETHRSLSATRRFVETAPLDYVQISPYWPVPNTPNYEAIVRETGIDTWREVIRSGPQEMLPLLDSELSMLELHTVASEMYRGFYLKPRRLLKLASNLRSIPQLRRTAAAGVDVLKGALPTVFGRYQ